MGGKRTCLKKKCRSNLQQGSQVLDVTASKKQVGGKGHVESMEGNNLLPCKRSDCVVGRTNERSHQRGGLMGGQKRGGGYFGQIGHSTMFKPR